MYTASRTLRVLHPTISLSHQKPATNTTANDQEKSECRTRSWGLLKIVCALQKLKTNSDSLFCNNNGTCVNPEKGLFNLLPYLITPPPPYKNVHDRFIHFRKNTFFIIWYNIPIYTIPKTHYPLGRGRGVVGVNVKGRTLSFRSYLLNINHLFNLHHQ